MSTHPRYDRENCSHPEFPNAAWVRIDGVRLVRGRIPAAVRKELNAAVKAGVIGHLAKDGHKPEAFFHPNSHGVAVGKRRAAENAALRIASGGITCRASDLPESMQPHAKIEEGGAA